MATYDTINLDVVRQRSPVNAVNMAATVKRDTKFTNTCSHERLFKDQPAPSMFSPIDKKKRNPAPKFSKMIGRKEKYSSYALGTDRAINI